jgi:hypothetical protein
MVSEQTGGARSFEDWLDSIMKVGLVDAEFYQKIPKDCDKSATGKT